jgi:2-polyprenyl-3-methyl-5-hydroxy-6-metoxy-1,4-benzoquinol methylase
VNANPKDSERSAGMYSWLSTPWVYDLCQRLIRSNASRATFFREHIRPTQGMNVLDVGCGTGDAMKHLGQVNYLGIDRNAAYIKVAKQRWNRSESFVCGDVSAISELSLGKFDVIFCLGVLHHLDDQTAIGLLREIASLLAPKGRFVSHDPVFVEEQSKAAKWIVSRDRGRFVRTRDAMESLAKAPFRSVKSTIDMRPLRIPYTEIILECRLTKHAIDSDETDNASCGRKLPENRS